MAPAPHACADAGCPARGLAGIADCAKYRARLLHLSSGEHVRSPPGLWPPLCVTCYEPFRGGDRDRAARSVH